MVDLDDQLNFELILRIFQSGHSRIPVYQVCASDVMKIGSEGYKWIYDTLIFLSLD